MTWKLLLLAACGVLTGAVIKALGYGKPEPTDMEARLKTWVPDQWAEREARRRREAFSALGTEGDRFVA